jgi:hypothetical protein
MRTQCEVYGDTPRWDPPAPNGSPKCLRCGTCSAIEKLVDNGFVCPFCDQWFCGPLRRNYLAQVSANAVPSARNATGETVGLAVRSAGVARA